MGNFGSAVGGAAGGAQTGAAVSGGNPWGTAIGAGVGFLGGLFGSNAGSAQQKLAQRPFESSTNQNFLPPALRYSNTGGILNAGVQGIGQMIENPGTLSPTVADAIRQQLATESENIAQNYRGIASNQAGAEARGNVPVSIRTALGSALDVAQERAQREARRQALIQSDTQRRQDLAQTYDLLNSILQFMSSGRGQAVAGLNSAGAMESQTKGSQLTALGSIISSLASMHGSGNGLPPATSTNSGM
jgi:hypothetical protein